MLVIGIDREKEQGALEREGIRPILFASAVVVAASTFRRAAALPVVSPLPARGSVSSQLFRAIHKLGHSFPIS